MSNDSNRRDFLKAAAAAGAVGLTALPNAHADRTDETIRVGLIGCGGRGTGAAEQCLNADRNVRLVAIADAFGDRAQRCVNHLRRERSPVRQKVDVPAERVFTGLDGYQRLLPLVDLVLLATPPGFRPTHIRAAIAARKHVFTEKPVAVDGPGIRTVLAACEEATRNRLSVVAGTQRRYQTGYRESMQRIHDGALGTITSGRCYWNQGGLWHAARAQNMSDVEWQIRNWLYFTWLSGDHICEQHVHNLDVINWALGNSHPVKATALAGRQVRTGPEFGHIFDHFAVDYEYPNGVRVLSMCRQIGNCDNKVTEAVTGTRGTWGAPSREERRPNYVITGERPWSFPARNDNSPYDEEHVQLLRSIRRGEPINDLRNVAHSTLTAIMGRMSAYTGKDVSWEQALNSQQSLLPANLTMDMRLPVPAVAMPGRTELR